MRIALDTEADAVYIQLQEGTFGTNREVAEGIILDVGEDEVILGIEILEASTRLAASAVTRLEECLRTAQAQVRHFERLYDTTLAALLTEGLPNDADYRMHEDFIEWEHRHDIAQETETIIANVKRLLREVGEDARDLLSAPDRPASQVEDELRELIALALFREGHISSGMAAELLGMSKLQFVQLLAQHDIPYFTESPDELIDGVKQLDNL